MSHDQLSRVGTGYNVWRPRRALQRQVLDQGLEEMEVCDLGVGPNIGSLGSEFGRQTDGAHKKCPQSVRVSGRWKTLKSIWAFGMSEERVGRSNKAASFRGSTRPLSSSTLNPKTSKP